MRHIPYLMALTAPLALSICVINGAHAQSSRIDLPVCQSVAERAVDTQAFLDPEMNQERQVEVGGALFVSDAVTVAETGLKVRKEATISDRYFGADFTVTIPPVTVGQDDVRNGGYAVPSATFVYGREKGERHGMSKPDIRLIDNKAGDSLHAIISFGFKTKDYIVPGAMFEKLRCQRPDPDALRTEILYGGAAKGVLTLQYREFMGGVARPAFSQDATFDLAEGNEIAFKGVHIKVLGTSNAGIRYVITGFNVANSAYSGS